MQNIGILKSYQQTGVCWYVVCGVKLDWMGYEIKKVGEKL